MKINKVKKQVERVRVISPAMYKEKKTDRVKEVSVQGADGVIRTEERPIYEKVLVEAVSENIVEEVTVWQIVDKDDVHEFATEKDAKSFLSGGK